MFWADKLLENQKGKQLVNDSWTPSGIIHMGSLKGPVIHDTLFRILKEKGALSKEDLIKEVLKQRQVKKNTIYVNLQNPRYFRKDSKNRYALVS